VNQIAAANTAEAADDGSQPLEDPSIQDAGLMHFGRCFEQVLVAAVSISWLDCEAIRFQRAQLRAV